MLVQKENNPQHKHTHTCTKQHGVFDKKKNPKIVSFFGVYLRQKSYKSYSFAPLKKELKNIPFHTLLQASLDNSSSPLKCDVQKDTRRNLKKKINNPLFVDVVAPI